jgi:hypothetical protein
MRTATRFLALAIVTGVAAVAYTAPAAALAPPPAVPVVGDLTHSLPLHGLPVGV